MSLRPALFAAATLVTAFGTCLVLGRWGAGRNADLSAIAQALQRGQELEGHLANRWRRDEAKRALAAEVVAGRMSLREAAGQFRRLDDRNPGLPPSTSRPAADERALYDQVLDRAWEVLAHEGRFAEASRWYAEVLTGHPHLLVGRPIGHRYWAACAAALAGCGQGRDATALDEESRAGFRQRALGWLRDELEAQRRRLETERGERRWIIAGGLQHWLRHPYFAGVREPDSLGRLPETERQVWQRLWTDVADTLARAEGATAPQEGAGRKGQLPER
jgi:hypothetical protein